MIELEDGEIITAAEHAAGIIEGTGKTEYTGMTKVLSVRLPATLVAQIQGLAHKSARTRNATMAMLLEVGIEEVKARLTPETLESLAGMTSEHYEDLIAEK